MFNIWRHLWILNFNFLLFVNASSEYFKYLANSLLLTTAEQSLAPSCEWHKIFQVPGHKTFRNTNLQPLSLDRWRRMAVLWKTTRIQYDRIKQSRQRKLILSKLNYDKYDSLVCGMTDTFPSQSVQLSHRPQPNFKFQMHLFVQFCQRKALNMGVFTLIFHQNHLSFIPWNSSTPCFFHWETIIIALEKERR